MLTTLKFWSPIWRPGSYGISEFEGDESLSFLPPKEKVNQDRKECLGIREIRGENRIGSTLTMACAFLLTFSESNNLPSTIHVFWYSLILCLAGPWVLHPYFCLLFCLMSFFLHAWAGSSEPAKRSFYPFTQRFLMLFEKAFPAFTALLCPPSPFLWVLLYVYIY